MGRWHGPYHEGACGELRALKRREAQARNAIVACDAQTGREINRARVDYVVDRTADPLYQCHVAEAIRIARRVRSNVRSGA